MKKAMHISAIICLLLILAAATPGSAAQTKTVVLVSDNVADSAVADAVKNVEALEIVTTPWGEYNESVVAEIEALAPDRIIIIGGVVAVPADYDTALDTYSIIRLSGEDRFETASKVLRHFEKNFMGKGIMVVYGYDTKGIQKALKKAKGMGWFVLFVKTDDVPLSVEDAIDKLTSGDVELFESPDSEIDKIMKKLEKKQKKVKLHSLNESEKAERALHMIEEAREEIEEAQEEIDERNITDGAAITLLETANTHLDNAQSAYDNQSYGEAFGQAVSAKHLAKNAEKFAKKDKEHLRLGGTKKDGKDHDDDEKDHDEDDDEKDDDDTTTTTIEVTTTTTLEPTTTTTETPTTNTTLETPTTTMEPTTTTTTTFEPTTTTVV